MHNNYETSEPRPVLTELVLNGKAISLKEGMVTALVGPNNSGKSHFLDQLEAKLAGVDSDLSRQTEGLIDSVKFRWKASGSSDTGDFNPWISRNLQRRKSGYYDVAVPEHFSVGASRLQNLLSWDEIVTIFSTPSSFKSLVGYFVRRDGPLSRVQESHLKDLRDDSLAKRVRDSEEALSKVSSYFHEVFGEDLSVYDIGGGTLGYKLSAPSENMPRVDQSYSSAQKKEMNQAPKVWEQGLGMQSVLGILLGLFADDRPIVLLDEPEAFLHPPQAIRLGQILRKVAERERRQIFCATHDKNILSGLANGGKGPLSIVRLSRATTSDAGSRFDCAIVPTDFAEDIRSKSRIRHTHLLDGLFSEGVVIVEDEKDAYFYSETINSMAAEMLGGLKASSICFVGVSGKNNIPSTFQLLRSLKAPTVVVADTDFIQSDNKKHTGGPFRAVISAYDLENANEVLKIRDDLEDCIVSDFEEKLDCVGKDKYEGQRKRIISQNLARLKSNGDYAARIEQLTKTMQRLPLCLVPGGELEDFNRNTNLKGADWVREALDIGLHRSDEVRSFLNLVLEKLRLEIDASFQAASDSI